MSLIHVFCVFITLFVKLFVAYGQSSCIPGPVRNLTVTTTAGLKWIQPEEHCNARSYLVIIKKEGNPNLLYYVEATNIIVTSLLICESYEFSVRAIAPDHVEGLETILYAKTPAPVLDLTVERMNATQNNQEIFLNWNMRAGIEHCVDLYRVVLWDEDTEIPVDIYVHDTELVIHSVVPCMKYEFEIRAVNGAQEEGAALYLNYTANAIPSAPPTLGGISQGSTSVNITWNLQSYTENRCPITALIADGSPDFYDVYPVTDSSARQPYSMTIIDLLPSTIYLCRIYVVNSGGNSSPLAIAIQTQPASYRNVSINNSTKY